MRDPEATFRLVSKLAQEAGLLPRGEPATPAIEAFARLVAARCLKVLDDTVGGSVLDPYSEIGELFLSPDSSNPKGTFFSSTPRVSREKSD